MEAAGRAKLWRGGRRGGGEEGDMVTGRAGRRRRGGRNVGGEGGVAAAGHAVRQPNLAKAAARHRLTAARCFLLIADLTPRSDRGGQAAITVR